MSGGYHQQDIIVFITDFDFQLSTDVYGPSCQLFSPSDPKVCLFPFTYIVAPPRRLSGVSGRFYIVF